MKNISRHMAFITTGLIVAGLLAAGRVNAADNDLSRAGSSFLKEASEGNQAEIALAQLALQKSQSPEVKNLAQMLEQEHQAAQQKVQALAQSHNVTLEQTPSWSDRRTQSKLEKLSGAEFDQQYTKDMLEGHVANIKKYQKAVKDVEDADVKQYAQDTLQHLQMHLQHSETAAKSVGVDQATITSITKSLPASVGGTGDNSESEHGTGQHNP